MAKIELDKINELVKMAKLRHPEGIEPCTPAFTINANNKILFWYRFKLPNTEDLTITVEIIE